LPGWFAGGRAQQEALPDHQRKIVDTLFRIEKSLAERIVKLDNVIDDALAGHKTVRDAELEDAARGFVEKGGIVDDFGPTNAFFGIFDRLIYLAEGNKGRRESSMILDITPPGGQTIRKFFMTGPAEDMAVG
jgi:hypothetical protein